jgi:Bacterial conjugation TrbI-like protein
MNDVNTTTIAQDHNKISGQDLRRIAQQSQSEGEYTSEEKPLVDKEKILNSDRQKQGSRPWRFFTVAIIASCAIFALILTSSLINKVSGGNSNKVAKTPSSDQNSEPRIIREDQLKADLAISEQKGIPQPKTEPKIVVEQPKQPVKTPTPDNNTQTAQAVEVEQEEEEIVEVDPLEEWARLANLGSAVGNGETAIANLSNDTNVVATKTSNPDYTSKPVQSVQPVSVANNAKEDNLDRISQSSPIPTSERISLPPSDNQITEKEGVKIASVSIGKDIVETDQVENQSTDFGLDSSAVSKLLSDQKLDNTYLEKKRRQFEEEDRLKELSAMGASSSLELVSVSSVSNSNHRPTPIDTEEQASRTLLASHTDDTELNSINEITTRPTLIDTEEQASRTLLASHTNDTELNSINEITTRPTPIDTEEQASRTLLASHTNDTELNSINEITTRPTPIDTEEQTLSEERTEDNLGTAKSKLASTIPDTPSQKEGISSKQVPLGAIIPGELASNIVWSEGSDPEQSRGIINLTEPLLASDGSIALKANSTLIAEVQSINDSGLTYLNVIAVSYEDSQGKLKQEILPPGAILIRGEENSALIAEQTSDPGGTVLGQDALIGLLGAGEMGFQELNKPDEDTTISGDNDFIIRTNNDDNSSLINGAAEGVFSTTKERLDERSDQIVEQELARVPIYQLEAGDQVTIFVNSFLEINK